VCWSRQLSLLLNYHGFLHHSLIRLSNWCVNSILDDVVNAFNSHEFRLLAPDPALLNAFHYCFSSIRVCCLTDLAVLLSWFLGDLWWWNCIHGLGAVWFVEIKAEFFKLHKLKQWTIMTISYLLTTKRNRVLRNLLWSRFPRQPRSHLVTLLIQALSKLMISILRNIRRSKSAKSQKCWTTMLGNKLVLVKRKHLCFPLCCSQFFLSLSFCCNQNITKTNKLQNNP